MARLALAVDSESITVVPPSGGDPTVVARSEVLQLHLVPQVGRRIGLTLVASF